MSEPVRTPEGQPTECPLCGTATAIEFSLTNDAVCPCCGHLLWAASQTEMHHLDREFEMLRQGIRVAPENVLFRRVLRGIEERRCPQTVIHTEQVQRTMSGIRRAVADALATRNWEAADIAAENGLAITPFDVELNIALGDATSARGFHEVAEFAWNYARRLAPDRTDIGKRLAKLEAR